MKKTGNFYEYVQQHFPMAKRWAQMSINKFKKVNKMWHVHKMKYYSAIERNEALVYAKRQLRLKITVHGRSRTGVYYIHPFVGNTQKRRVHKDSRLVVSGGSGQEE